LDYMKDVCDRIAILNDGELQELGEVRILCEVASRVEVQASGLALSEELRRDLEVVFQRHGGRLESLGHPTTTLEDLFLHIVEESKAHPGRRFRPTAESPATPAARTGDGASAARVREENPARS